MKTQTIAVVGTIALAAVLMIVALRAPPGAAPGPVPQPNGYDSFLRAGQMLAVDSPRLDELSTDELKALVARNAPALAIVRAGLQQQTRVPVRYSISYATNHGADLIGWKRVARALIAEGKLGEQEGRYRDAEVSYLDTIRFGHECRRGGLIIDMLVGVACESLGCQGLQGIADQLKPADCREAVHQLEQIESKAQSAKEIAEQEQDWSRRTFGWRARLATIVMGRNLQQVAQKTLGKLQTQQRTERLLKVELEKRGSELDHSSQ